MFNHSMSGKTSKMGRYQILFYMFTLYLVINALMRLVLFFAFGLSQGMPVIHLPATLVLGMLNDVVTSLYVFMPLSLYLCLLPNKWYQSKVNRCLLFLLVFASVFGLLYLSVVQYYFFEEYSARFNLVAVDYLIYPHEVFVNIWDSYPVVNFLLGVFTAAVLLMIYLWPRVKSSITNVSQFSKRFVFFLSHVAGVVIAVFTIYTHSFDFTSNRVSNEIAANGISSLFEAFHTNKLDYDAYYKTNDRQEMFSLLVDELQRGGGQFTQLDKQQLNRHFVARKDGLGRLNVVLLVEESFGARFSGAYGAAKSLTPNFDALAKQGLLFTNAYATGTRTVRGLEAITASFPPIPSEAIIKRPGSEHIANWGDVMRVQGYSASFLYGGYGLFDNMNHFYENNGFIVSDRKDIKDVSFSNIWGVSDEDLFKHSIKHFNRLNEKGKPFFALIMSTSNHKPYTFPPGVPGVPQKDGGRDAGVRYADYAIGKFFQLAKKQAWFNNTIFVVVADHDARVYGSAQIPVYSYKIPLLIYSPKHIKPGVVKAAISQIDIAPTVLGLLGLPYDAPFFGQDVLHWPAKYPRRILLNHNHDVALESANQFAVLGLQKSVKSYIYQPKNQKLLPTKKNQSLEDLAVAYYQLAYYLFKQHKYVSNSKG